jgi:hypothetical protein
MVQQGDKPKQKQKAKTGTSANTSESNSPQKTPPSASIQKQTPAAPHKQQQASSETAPPASTTAAASTTEEPQQQSGSSAMEVETSDTTRLFFLKFSLVTKPYNLPTVTEVALAGLTYFQQEGMKCIPFRTHGETCYKFELREEVPCEGHVLKFNGFDADLSPWVARKDMPRKEGTLITFQNAGCGALEAIPGEVFDSAMEHLNLVVIVPTKLQVHKQTRVLNGNRLCIVDTPENLKIIPESIPVVDPITKKQYQVTITYRGQEKYCRRCNVMHVGGCPIWEERKRKSVQREEMQREKQFNTKIYSDSTLRNVDVLGLKSEVLCMSGGGLGQIIQAAIDDPDEDYEKVVILGGINDMKPQNFTSSEDFAHNIDLACAKLITYAKTKPQKTFYLVQQAPRRDEDQPHPEAILREMYLWKRMKRMEEVVNNLETFQITYEVDQTGHPTEAGTREILRVFDTVEIPGEPLIWSEDDITTDRIYSGVQAIFRYGCNGCEKFGKGLVSSEHNNQLLCDECHTRFPAEPNELLGDLATNLAKVAAAAKERDYPHAKRHKADANGQNK